MQPLKALNTLIPMSGKRGTSKVVIDKRLRSAWPHSHVACRRGRWKRSLDPYHGEDQTEEEVARHELERCSAEDGVTQVCTKHEGLYKGLQEDSQEAAEAAVLARVTKTTPRTLPPHWDKYSQVATDTQPHALIEIPEHSRLGNAATSTSKHLKGTSPCCDLNSQAEVDVRREVIVQKALREQKGLIVQLRKLVLSGLSKEMRTAGAYS